MEGWMVIGDIHSTHHCIAEAEALLDYAARLARQNEAKGCILLGDLFDNHQNVNLSVVYSYCSVFNKHPDLQWLMIPGNHDHSVHGSRLEHALLPFKDLPNVKVFDADCGMVESYDNMDFAPFIRTEEEFLKLCEHPQNSLLICHQEFTGAQYEGGFFAPNGTDVKKVPYDQIISGHIHTEQQVGACQYIGAPRWFTVADANRPKFIYFLKNKKLVKKYSTEAVCAPIYRMAIDETSELPVLKENARYIFDVKGKAKFLERINNKYAGKAEIRGVVDTEKSVSVRESGGINESLENFILNDYKCKYVENKYLFWEKLKEELNDIR